MVIVVNYGIGNIFSVKNMLGKAGIAAKISNDPKEILEATKIVLPGVGHYDYGMQMLNKSGLRESLDYFALDLKRPVLGICLGAQILGHQSEEGKEKGLGWVNMQCIKLPSDTGLRIPHMRWNNVKQRIKSPLFDVTEEEARFYFVHSYYMQCSDAADVIGTTQHGIEFTCAIQKDNIYGVQFHPEKSLRHGLELMRSFGKI
jgi:glutamine amidotransferase